MNVLVITGSMGAGKTSVLGEASDLLARRDLAHAAIDLDALNLWHHGSAIDPGTANLRCVAGNYAACGIDRLLLAGAIETRGHLQIVLDATASRSSVVCRLRAPIRVMEGRVAVREHGIGAALYISRVSVLERILDEASIEDFTLDATRTVTEIAEELLQRARWITAPGGEGR